MGTTQPSGGGHVRSIVLSRIAHLLTPLDDFYAAEGRGMPDIVPLAGDAVVEPYRTLLVHENDMTPTLEAFCGERLHLRVLEAIEAGHELRRRVVLVTAGDRPIEFGAIRIRLDHFDEDARMEIREGYKPLGTLLGERAIAHVCHPAAFFRARADERICAAFGLDAPQDLFGRHNMLEDRAGTLMAEVVEILPPFES